MFTGSIVALVTPFKDGLVDYDKLGELVEYHIENGTNAIIPCGTTGESPTLTHKEHGEVIGKVIEIAKGRIPVIAGTGSNSTSEALSLTKHAKEAGADGSLMITPYYNKPTQEGLYEHYKSISDAVDIPIIIYNVPSRTGVSISPETVARLYEMKNIVAIKEASGNIDQTSQILNLCDITVLSGDDSLTLPIMSVGGKGVVSVVANILPGEVSEMVSSFLNGELEKSQKMHKSLFPICRAMFIETNPIPVKTAMKLLGRINGEMRLPLCKMSDEHEKQLQKVLIEYGLI
ncbi:MAG: 4-hydroxy-tetrahydrodipicolinate synthase [Planctomycetes bacterium GWF2_40_8]|nr:MAG: 4-hydroxy-tetrahydrodipicolinate synthase [Planctomycetes bacterium GWF2_40_8]OHB90317.1 MAG: 4-hydroxy-tetrahydrodipicolinate synthase [Planctomycetes bacterium RIFCSPHIGHO2_02_FULL_40_12]OHC04827.1 MAG: 4-hydroxy-tetrahydrodipicolinate synthase [Planctomycetes bacterium RIFCSPLOWO2_12_FULL_40_19]